MAVHSSPNLAGRDGVFRSAGRPSWLIFVEKICNLYWNLMGFIWLFSLCQLISIIWSYGIVTNPLSSSLGKMNKNPSSWILMIPNIHLFCFFLKLLKYHQVITQSLNLPNTMYFQMGHGFCLPSHVSTFGLLVCFDTSQWIEQSTFGVNIFSKNESVNILFLDCSNPFICIDEDLVPNDLALQP